MTSLPMLEKVMRPMPKGARECSACCGTGEPSPWEYDHHVWVRGEPIAVCGACRGAGSTWRFGFRISAGNVLARYREMNRIFSEGGGE